MHCLTDIASVTIDAQRVANSPLAVGLISGCGPSLP